EPRGIEAGYKWPQFSIHRGTLQQILLDAAIERLGRESILTSHHLTGWSETADGIRAEFIDKATGKPAGTHEGDLLIAADGIHSAVREKLYPQEGPPIWNGRILWRGITAGDAFLTGRTMIMAGHEILKFVCYPISKEADADGKYQINWVAERHMPPSYQWRREDYNRTAKLASNAALVAYEAERRPATTGLVMLNRRNGPEQVMQLVEERAPDGYKVVTDVLSLRELEDIAANYKRVAGFQVEGLNAKPPIVQLPDARRASA